MTSSLSDPPADPRPPSDPPAASGAQAGAASRATRLLAAMLAFRDGDFSVRLPLDWDGVDGQIAVAFNQAMAHSDRFSQEVERLRRTVGHEGRLRQRMSVPGGPGSWADTADRINMLLDDLVRPTTEIARTIGAVANGDLGQSMQLEVDFRPLRGEFLRSATLVNAMIDQLRVFTLEVTRVAREVGTEGKLGGQAKVDGVSGVWKELTESVNHMAGNLTTQVRSIADVTIAVAGGDLSKKITVDVRGEILQLKEAINTMVDQLRSFASEVTRVAREVGTEGKLGGQAVVPGVAGTWKDLTDSVNFMASNLTDQVRNIAGVTTAVARGDLSRKITVDVKGEILALKNTINTMVDQLNAFASEVTRVAREVGTEGRLGGQAAVPGVAGTWKDLTDNVNFMASNLTGQVRNIAEVTTAVAKGDLSRKITVDVKGEIRALKTTINTMVDQLNSFAAEVTRVAREVGSEGRLGGQAVVPGVAGTWKDLTDSVNSMASNLTGQVRNIAEVATAVAKGDLSKQITVDVKGELFELKVTLNTMVDQLNSFAAEVTRVAREVGSEGKLGGQAAVPGVAGTWKDLTDNVNLMANNLTDQVRNIAGVATAIARGDLSSKITVEAKGEILALKSTMNTMVDQLNGFASEVTRVAREVGTEGRLGVQAEVPGVGGTWKDLTDSVNTMGSNLAAQVRSIADVTTAVARGELNRKITVDVKGEVLALKDTINTMVDQLNAFASEVTRVAREVGTEGKLGGQAVVPGVGGTWKDLTDNVNLMANNLTTMISNLRETTERSREQDWLKTHLAGFTSMFQGQRDLRNVGRMLLSELAPLVKAHQGTVYHLGNGLPPEKELRLLASYAHAGRPIATLRLGEGLVGQCALEKRRIILEDVPPQFAAVSSSLGAAPLLSIVVLPVLFEGETKAVVELAAVHRFTTLNLAFLDQLAVSLGAVFNTIEATMRTEGLLAESQRLTAQLQSRQHELQHTNEELATKARLLAEQNAEVERKSAEVENAKFALEEKAAELALTSKYKSEFLANMSHELRTPLNSILILSQQLAGNPAGTLSGREVEFSRNIHSSGSDLLNLINDILDLSKIESGTVTLDIEDIPFGHLRDSIERMFHHVAEAKSLSFEVAIAEGLPRAIDSDPKRLQQILKNLLSNAVKFTSRGHVALRISPAAQGWSASHPVLGRARQVVAFSVEDTGIGIPPGKQKLIFEAFQQADAGTSRKYGGTGLGLAISRELASLLGGELKVASVPREGSTFTLYLPLHCPATEGRRFDPVAAVSAARAITARPARTGELVADDRERLAPGDAVLLVIEEDPRHARRLLEAARDIGYKGIAATEREAGLALAARYRPDAICLGVSPLDRGGWSVLDRLKHDPATRHIPVQVLTEEDERVHALARGALAWHVRGAAIDGVKAAFVRLFEFAQRRRRLLIAAGDAAERQALSDLLGGTDIETEAVATGHDAIRALARAPFDCVVLDLHLPDVAGTKVLERMAQDAALAAVPVVVTSATDPTAAQESALRSIARNMVIKDVRSRERLFDQTALLLHRAVATMAEEKQALIARVQNSGEMLRRRKVLLVDDDARNIFALTSLLENEDMHVIAATSGRVAIDIVSRTPDLAIVLMDIMMPGLDGYEIIRTIRRDPRHGVLPILAVTAKAMKGDREKCLDAGASDYISKPVDAGELLSLMRMWLFR